MTKKRFMLISLMMAMLPFSNGFATVVPVDLNVGYYEDE